MELTTRLLQLGGLTLPRANLVAYIKNAYPFIDRIGKHDGPAQLLQYIQGPVDLFSSTITGEEIVTSRHGTATVSVSAGKLSVSSGTLWSFTLSNGSQYEFGSGGWVWDVSGNNRSLSVVESSCLESREFGSDWLNVMGWTVYTGRVLVYKWSDGNIVALEKEKWADGGTYEYQI